MTEVNVFRDGKVHVRAEQCDNCLLSKNRLVGAERARQLIRNARDTEGGTFVCHRNQVSDEPEAICAAWWALYANEDPILRLAQITKSVAYVRTRKENDEGQQDRAERQDLGRGRQHHRGV